MGYAVLPEQEALMNSTVDYCDYIVMGGGTTAVMVCGVIAIIVMIFSVVYTVFKSHHTVVRAANPKLLYACSFGAIICASSVLFTVGEASISTCTVPIIVLTTGYNIMYGALSVKIFVIVSVNPIPRPEASSGCCSLD